MRLSPSYPSAHLYFVYQANVLVNDDHQACITDFGVSIIPGDSSMPTSFGAGTCRWMAYELMGFSCEEEHDSRNITVATDVWAFGLTALEVRY
jgi:serine/threonine protein kinase